MKNCQNNWDFAGLKTAESRLIMRRGAEAPQTVAEKEPTVDRTAVESYKDAAKRMEALREKLKGNWPLLEKFETFQTRLQKIQEKAKEPLKTKLNTALEARKALEGHLVDYAKVVEPITETRIAAYKTAIEGALQALVAAMEAVKTEDANAYEALTKPAMDATDRLAKILETDQKTGLNVGNGIELTDLNSLKTAEADMEKAGEHLGEWLQSGKRLASRLDTVTEFGKTAPDLQENPLFQDMKNYLETQLGLNEFASLSQTSEGVPSDKAKRDHLNNALAILRFETHNFEDVLPFADLTNDPVANKKRYPFLYHEWMENQVKGATERQQTLSREIGALAKENGINLSAGTLDTTSVDKKVTEITTNAPEGVQDALKKVVPDPLKTPDDYKTWANRIDAIKMAYQRIPDGPEKALAQQKIQTLEPILTLARKMVSFKQLSDRIQEQEKSFTRANVSQERDFTLDAFLNQYQKAAKIVDSVPGLNPTVRMQLIASVYEWGVAEYRVDAKGNEVYTDTVKDDYTWMLTQLAQSERFNARHLGLKTREDQRNFLLVARTANDKLYRWRNAQEKADSAWKTLIEKAPNKDAVVQQITDLETQFVEIALQTNEGKLIGRDRDKLLSIVVESVINPEQKDELLDLQQQIKTLKETLVREALNQAAAKEGLSEGTKAILEFPLADRQTQLEALGTARATREKIDPVPTGAALAELGLIERVNQLENAAKTETDAETKATLEKLIDYEKNTQNIWIQERFLAEVRAYMANPDSPESLEFMNSIMATSEADELSGSRMRAYSERMKEIDLNRELMEFQNRSRQKTLDIIGFRTEGIYEAYKAYVANNPEVAVDQWENLSQTPEGVAKLYRLMKEIIPTQSDKEGKTAKEDYLRVLETWHADVLLKDNPEAMNFQAMAWFITKEIGLEIKLRQDAEIAKTGSEEEILASLEGMTIGDKIEKYARGVFDMVMGPGQSLSNRAAGVILLALAYKGLKKAWAGEDTLGKGLRYLFVAGSVELALKKITGRGILDRAGLGAITEAIKGTNESILVEKGKETLTDVTPEQHTAALYELNKVPFGNVLAWYENSKEDGQPLEGKEDTFDSLGIDVYNITKGAVTFTEKDEEKEGRRIVKSVIKNFLNYVGEKDGKDHRAGLQIAKERWVKAMQSGFDINKAEYSNFVHEAVISQFQGDTDSLTWEVVMNAEINPDDMPEDIVDKAKRLFEEGWNTAKKFSYNDIWRPTQRAGREFITYAGEKYQNDIGPYLEDMATKGATGLYYTKESVGYWINNNKHEIKRLAGEHWALLVEGVSLPFELIYGIDRALVPWVTTKLRQTREIIRSDRGEQIKDDLDPSMILNVDLDTLENRDDPKENPEFRYFGFYQEAFAAAAKKTLDTNKNRYTQVDGIGYLITETDHTEIGISDPTRATDRKNVLRSESWNKAVDYYEKTLNIPREKVIKYMYPIHVMEKTGVVTPEKVYMFWRMPLPGDMEYAMKEDGRWVDYMDPNSYKDREAFTIKYELGRLENLIQAYGIRHKYPREIYSFGGRAVALWMKAALKVVEGGGDVVQWAVKYLPGNMRADWLDKLTEKPISDEWLRGIDEALTSAQSTTTALSDFYKNNPARAAEYKRRYEAAKQASAELDVSNIK